MSENFRWPKIEVIKPTLKIPAGFDVAQMSEKEIPMIIDLLQKWYPDIDVGSESVHLTTDFYTKECLLKETTTDKNVYPLKFFNVNDGEIIGFMSMRKDVRARSVFGGLGVTAPGHRSEGFGMLGSTIFLETAKLMKAGIVYTYVTLKHPYNQIVLEKLGFKLVGIVPAFDIDQVDGKTQKRVWEALYAKVLANPSEIESPKSEAMTPVCKKLYEHLFNTAEN